MRCATGFLDKSTRSKAENADDEPCQRYIAMGVGAEKDADCSWSLIRLAAVGAEFNNTERICR